MAQTTESSAIKLPFLLLPFFCSIIPIPISKLSTSHPTISRSLFCLSFSVPSPFGALFPIRIRSKTLSLPF